SAFTPRDAEVLIPGLRVEFCRLNGLVSLWKSN
ncbi:hypothetical protein ACUOA8_28035, partial [Escherichia sp. SS-MK2]